jgi:hypothetical protein
MNKKGVGAETATFMAIFFFMVVVVIFLAIFKVGSVSDNVELKGNLKKTDVERIETIHQSQQLNRLLLTEVQSGKTFAEIIIEGINNDNYLLVKSFAEKNIPGEKIFWLLEVREAATYVPGTIDYTTPRLFRHSRPEWERKRGARSHFSAVYLPNPANEQVPFVVVLFLRTDGVPV